jgi:hypothetical protein
MKLRVVSVMTRIKLAAIMAVVVCQFMGLRHFTSGMWKISAA